MKFFIDSVSKDLVLAIFDKNFELVDSNIVEIKNKADLLPELVRNILSKNNLKITDFSDFYINLGPGTFTGCRVGLTFFRTLAQLGDINLWTCSTFSLLSFEKKEKRQYFISYSKNSQFSAFAHDGQLISEISDIKSKNVSDDQVDYQIILNNFAQAQKLFKKEENLVNVFPLYNN
ncbi:tRNA (adenosine(37)-N6)-threonylcarbamoyltransferase complex dimerization subunit type 1 TsaB [Mesomycoplasma ovipneumoniae]|uniref:tRNA (adenosine(37)-N6)-threonylcarbamoyltransferase complex dimerization subunit type 1 TsaB n=1 Tax=Mesomycoplasma ovipneumoniae TaxID=29562 RepID=UPI00083E7BBF|nr:tRNA (adenosine(37)-N6)-threonylcarbamoyltransferase complex dimerization subunit type 1 TsaB [Mesomycoplasma ovipneumoniae]WDV48729.1 tRNA (adenosine(37)-N6)-threonylcarbamoyltransferase complex dimerization subunit type 1 TsaB [Mesomycoplasma ovipneumoniae ATCC 29419]